MNFIDTERLDFELASLKQNYVQQKPFRFIVIDDFFKKDAAELIYQSYPSINQGNWRGITYMNQMNKFELSDFSQLPLWSKFFEELNSNGFIEWLEKLSGINEPLIADKSLFGAGLHQSVNDAFLNVHVDYNIHPHTQYHRRLNVLIYMNKEWKKEYGGYIEFWDFSGNKKSLIESFMPSFNRCLIFETNEISFHGHPKPLRLPQNESRKSISVYYYSKERPKEEIFDEHNTIFKNTEGIIGRIRVFKAGARAFIERIL